MIIVPTEKRFDWQNAPVVLFFIVIINVLVFYAYQTGDSDHFDEALRIYVSDGLYQKELPHYREFLSQQGDEEKMAFFKQMEQHPNTGFAAAFILQDEEFFDHLISHGADIFEPDYYKYWHYQREYIHELIFEVSFKKYGLIANDLNITSLITHQFLHGSVMHLLGNMFFLIICGFAVEASLGHKTFLIFYLLTGVGAGLAYALMDLASTMPMVGASGAVSGVMAMYLGIFRLKKIEFFYWFFVFVGYFRAPALLILPFYIINELVSLWTQPHSNVAFMAHVGGFVTGAALIALVLWRKPETLNKEYIESDHTATPEQLSLDQIYQSMDRFTFETALKRLENHMTEFAADFNLKILKYKLLQTVKPEQARGYFNQIVQSSRPNKPQLAKVKKIWQDLAKDDSPFDQETQYKLAWNFITVPEHIEQAVQLFEDLYHAENKHPSLHLLAQKLAGAYKRLENRTETDKYQSLAQELG
ncbi:MAG: rhomboid family intramembrane serine protease [Proteobacteria bacterium]|nr:MAG: rhomboid family intramembrane serine protease [Pseudomonadota bacterium]